MPAFGQFGGCCGDGGGGDSVVGMIGEYRRTPARARARAPGTHTKHEPRLVHRQNFRRMAALESPRREVRQKFSFEAGMIQMLAGSRQVGARSMYPPPRRLRQAGLHVRRHMCGHA